MASYVSINLHYEVTQTRLTFCLPGSPPCRFVFVIAAYVNKGALLFCSALHQNLFRIRNLILPRALLALDQSAHLQISEQINTAVLRASALFTFCNLQRTSMLCSCHITGRMGERVGVKGGEEAFPHLQVVTSVQGMAERVSASGVIYLISNPFWEESLGAIPIFTERFRASQLTGQKGKDSLCVGDEWQNESWPSVGLWSVMRNKETVGLSKRKAIRPDLTTVPGFQIKWWHIILFSTIYWIISKGKHVLKSETGWTFEEEDVKDNVEWRLMRLLFCHTSRVLSRAAPRHGARPALLFLGSKYGCYVIFRSAEQVAQVAPEPFTLPPCRNWTGRGPGRALNVLTLCGMPICWGWVRTATHEQLPAYQRKLAARCETSDANLA